MTHFKQLCKQIESEQLVCNSQGALVKMKVDPKPKHSTLLNLNHIVNKFKELHQLSKQKLTDLPDNVHLLEEFGPLRLISVLQAGMTREPKDVSVNEKCLLAYTTMQLLNLLCDDTP